MSANINFEDLRTAISACKTIEDFVEINDTNPAFRASLQTIQAIVGQDNMVSWSWGMIA